MYKNPEENIMAEFSIYDENMKEDILKVHTHKIILPFYISWMLILLKMIYYNFGIIDNSMYKKMKSFVLDYLFGTSEEFLVFEK